MYEERELEGRTVGEFPLPGVRKEGNWPQHWIRFLSLSLFLLCRQHLSTFRSVRPGSSSNRPFLPDLAHPFRWLSSPCA